MYINIITFKSSVVAEIKADKILLWLITVNYSTKLRHIVLMKFNIRLIVIVKLLMYSAVIKCNWASHVYYIQIMRTSILTLLSEYFSLHKGGRKLKAVPR